MPDPTQQLPCGCRIEFGHRVAVCPAAIRLVREMYRRYRAGEDEGAARMGYDAHFAGAGAGSEVRK